jgi:hypothetical protein
VFAVAVLPVAVVLTDRLEQFHLLHAAAAIPVAVLVSFFALVLAARARRQVQLTLGRVGGDRLARIGRALGLLGIYVAFTAGLAVGFYAVLAAFSE